MNRRDFFTLRSSDGQQIMRLSCQRLYTKFSDARSWLARTGLESAEATAGDDENWWEGEPPLEVEALSEEQLFAELRKQVVLADVLVLENREWIQDEEFSRRIRELLDQFRAGGGEVRYSINNSETCGQV